MAFAGLWEQWRNRDAGKRLTSCAIIATADELMRPIHERMPVILDPADFGRWLDLSTERARDLLRPTPVEDLESYPVSRAVNSLRTRRGS